MDAFLAILAILPFVLFWVGIPIFVYIKFLKKKSNKKFLKGKTVVHQYEPPEDLAASELGLLADQTSGRLEFLAALYGLKTKKIIEMSREDSTVRIKLLQYPQDKLAIYEDLILRYFFHENHEVVINEFFGRLDYTYLQSYVNYQLMQVLQQKGYIFIEEGYDTQPYRAYVQKVASNPGKVVFQYYWNQGIRKQLTSKGIDSFPIVEGFKRYIETAELDKIKFHAQGNLEDYIERLTPYAIALGQMERWQVIGIPIVTALREEDMKKTGSPSSVKQQGDQPLLDVSIVDDIDSYVITKLDSL